MTLKKITLTFAVIILLGSVLVSIVLYKTGDKVFDEIIEQAILTEVIPPPPSEAVKPNTVDRQNQGTSAAPITEQSASGLPKQPVNSAAEPTKEAEPTGSVQTTAQKIEKIKEQVSASDKMSIAALVFSKLSQSDIDELTRMVSGGLSSREKERAKRIAFARFTEAEIREIKQYYYKYANLVYNP